MSREGVQRDLLPIVEGATVSTKHGMVKTDHILFIASGAFSGLIAGILLGVANIFYSINVGHSIFGDIHFLLTVPFYFAWSLLVMVVVSLATKKPPIHKIEGLTFS